MSMMKLVYSVSKNKHSIVHLRAVISRSLGAHLCLRAGCEAEHGLTAWCGALTVPSVLRSCLRTENKRISPSFGGPHLTTSASPPRRPVRSFPFFIAAFPLLPFLPVPSPFLFFPPIFRVFSSPPSSTLFTEIICLVANWDHYYSDFIVF